MSARTASIAVWIALVTALGLLQAAAVASRGRIPTLDALVRRVAANAWSRTVLLLGWMWVGWHLFAR